MEIYGQLGMVAATVVMAGLVVEVVVVVVLTKKDVGDAHEAISVCNISFFLVCRELKFCTELKKNVL